MAADAPVRVTAYDPDNGDSGTREVVPGDYCLIVNEPAYLDGIKRYSNGTVVLTIKQRNRRRKGPRARCPRCNQVCAVRKDGTTGGHRAAVYDATWGSLWGPCPGSYTAPVLSPDGRQRSRIVREENTDDQ
jgi:hypothetical protein